MRCAPQPTVHGDDGFGSLYHLAEGQAAARMELKSYERASERAHARSSSPCGGGISGGRAMRLVPAWPGLREPARTVASWAVWRRLPAERRTADAGGREIGEREESRERKRDSVRARLRETRRTVGETRRGRDAEFLPSMPSSTLNPVLRLMSSPRVVHIHPAPPGAGAVGFLQRCAPPDPPWSPP
ncbi:hypothetical protein BS78_K287200 [Paspalum vaginatum]|uniref:Uncharacterized protein n=1 Tax=Paspalum vaginatum TaxID=158149 RepID=A0A9W7XDC5_9POAL|nr:hypothetical protein BS78_K287200 [Paspalum vaginatum]